MPPYQPPGSGQTVEAVVKWFNTTKGFGFVAVSDGSEAFLHISALEQAGLTAPREGATLRCEIGAGKKGPQVTRVLAVADGAGGAAMGGGRPSPRPPVDTANLANTVEVEGTVKWFSPERGYGFVTADDGGADVFVHVDYLRRAGIPGIDTDQRVALAVATTHKGREARAVRLLS